MKKGMRLLLLLLFAQPSLFISPGNPPSLTNPPQTSVTQTGPGQPLPPGTVTYRHTCNQTRSQQCASAQLPPDPLSPRVSNWTIVVNTPTHLFIRLPASWSSVRTQPYA